jgi:hypothetical protein
MPPWIPSDDARLADPACPVIYDIPLSEVASSRVHQFDNYWRGKCVAGRLPGRADIDPIEMKALLPYIAIVDLETAPFRVRYRLCGTIVANHNGELTNRYLDEVETLTPVMRARSSTVFATVQQERRPYFVRDYVILKSGAAWPLFGGVWPLSSDGQTIDQCVGLEDYPNRDAR